jgi:hypothetical protein
MPRFIIFVLCLSLFFALAGVGCKDNGGGGNACPETNVSLAVCDPEDGGPFSLNINNPFFPLVVGSESMLEGEDDEGAMVLLIITVLDEEEVVAGVTTRVLEEMEFVDGELIEVSRNFFAQAPDGTVCYFGEEVDICEDGLDQVGDEFFCDGEEPSHEGAWRADEPGNQPGIIMLADPEVGDIYSQEIAPGVAEDQAEVLALGMPIEVPAGEFEDTLTTEDCNPLDGGTDIKVFVNGIGLAIDENLELLP